MNDFNTYTLKMSLITYSISVVVSKQNTPLVGSRSVY